MNITTPVARSRITIRSRLETLIVAGAVLCAALTASSSTNNSRPVALGLGGELFEDTSLALLLTAFDPDGDPLTFIVGAPRFGTLSGTPPNILYRPNTNFYGLDSFTFTVRDGQFTSEEAVVSLRILPVDDPPVAFPGSVSLDEDSTVAITLVAYDPDGDPLIYFVNSPAHGILAGTPPNLTYTPARNYHGPDSFSFAVSDGTASFPISPPVTINIEVRPVNDRPFAQSQSVSTSEDTPVVIALTASDVDGDALSWTVTAPMHGTLTGAAPNLNYTPAPDYHGPDQFTFKVNDGQMDSAVATVSIIVTPVNDAPVVHALVEPLALISSASTNWVVISSNQSNALVILDASLTYDVENDPLQFFWTEAGATMPFAAGERVTNEFAVGFHTVVLTVDDGTDSATGDLSFDVLTPGEAVEAVALMVNGSALPHRTKRPLLATLKACIATFDRGHTTAALNQLHAFQNKVRAQVGRIDAALADDFIRACDRIVAAIEAR